MAKSTERGPGQTSILFQHGSILQPQVGWFIHLSPRKAETPGGFGVKSLWSLLGCGDLLRVCFSCQSCNQGVASRFTTCFCLVKASSWLTIAAPRNIYLLSVSCGCSYFSRHCQRCFSSLQHNDTNTWVATLKERMKIIIVAFVDGFKCTARQVGHVSLSSCALLL